MAVLAGIGGAAGGFLGWDSYDSRADHARDIAEGALWGAGAGLLYHGFLNRSALGSVFGPTVKPLVGAGYRDLRGYAGQGAGWLRRIFSRAGEAAG